VFLLNCIALPSLPRVHAQKVIGFGLSSVIICRWQKNYHAGHDIKLLMCTPDNLFHMQLIVVLTIANHPNVHSCNSDLFPSLCIC
jgi:hypothetical protein